MSKPMSKIKSAPHSKESEMMVLGSMLTNINSLNVAADGLEEADFYFTEHKIIFQVLKTAYRNDKPADIHLIAEELKRQQKLSAVGGIASLTMLAQYAGSSAYIEEYVDLVRSKSTLRRMVVAAQEVEKAALNEPSDVKVLLDEAQSKFFLISQSANPDAGVSVKDLLSGLHSEAKLPYLKELQEKQEQYLKKGPEDLGITGIPSHFVDLDKMINGLCKSNLMILAARPAMGKTALASNIAENVAFKTGLPVGVFSLEMTAEQLLHRMICSQSEVASERIRTGSLNGLEYQRVVSAVNSMMDATVIIDDQPGLKITDLRARARRMKESHNIQFLVVDYLQLISGSGLSRGHENRQNEISEISRMMKTLARELSLPILCLSQLSRKVEERQGHRPMMSDLRESGCLAEDTLIIDSIHQKAIPIAQLAERNVQVPLCVRAICPSKRTLQTHLMSRVFYSGKKSVFSLKTKQGRQIKASANHPFFTPTGWEKLENLTVGHALAVNNSHALSWDSVAAIDWVGEQDVYDATVPNVHNFVANDIVVHNSIEQDSDIVMFLLRREYYDPFDKPGLAELIVAKNRHGAVGTINLTYRKELAQFVNYSSLKTDSDPSDNTEAFTAFNPI